MKLTAIHKVMLAGSVLAIGFGACKKSDNNPTPPTQPTVYYDQADQVGRPAINTVFIPASGKDSFNTTIPSGEAAVFTGDMKTTLLTLNAGYDSNILNLSADALIGVLSTDVLNVATSGPTSYYNGTQVLTGRALGDDVIDVSLILVFGGKTGGSNPGLTSDNVAANDKAFLPAFPYLATPW